MSIPWRNNRATVVYLDEKQEEAQNMRVDATVELCHVGLSETNAGYFSSVKQQDCREQFGAPN